LPEVWESCVRQMQSKTLDIAKTWLWVRCTRVLNMFWNNYKWRVSITWTKNLSTFHFFQVKGLQLRINNYCRWMT
jgi:hypothetical protein